MSDDLEAIRNRVLTELRAQPRARLWWREALAVVAVCVGVTVVVLVGSSWQPHPGFGDPEWWIGFFLLAGVMGGGSLIAIAPQQRRHKIFNVVAVAVLTLMAIVIVGTHMLMLSQPQTSFYADAECFLVEVGVSLVPGIAMVMALRRFAMRRLAALCGGLAAGACGMIVLHLACHVPSLSHWLVFHLLPYALVVVIVVFVRARLDSHSAAP
ncbi:MAG: NrsF family protein [Myxococcota bacterium]